MRVSMTSSCLEFLFTSYDSLPWTIFLCVEEEHEPLCFALLPIRCSRRFNGDLAAKASRPSGLAASSLRNRSSPPRKL